METYNHYFIDYLQDKKAKGEYRIFQELEKTASKFPNVNIIDWKGAKKEVVNWCSNDYLGLGNHPEILHTYSQEILKNGAGSGGTRNISGNTINHKYLEQKIAELHNKEASLLFNGAYLANYSSLSALGKLLGNPVFISDSQNHASLIEGIKSSRCDKLIFNHNETESLETALKTIPINRPKVIVFQSIYSMSGDVAPIEEIIRLAKKYNSLTYVDEVHAVGLYGNGGGMAQQLGLDKDIDIINGTLSKGLGVLGGYIAASEYIIDAIRLQGSGFIFTTSLPAAVCAAAAKSIHIASSDKYLQAKFHKKVKTLRHFLNQYKIAHEPSPSHITPIKIGDANACKNISDILLNEYGVYIQPINYPTVPKGEECLRITITPLHTTEHMVRLANALTKVLPKRRRKYTNKPQNLNHAF